MKRIVLAVLVILVLSSGAFASSKTLTVDAYSLSQGIFNGQIEIPRDESSTVVIGGSTGSLNYGVFQADGFGVNAGYRWYPQRNTQNGLFIQGGAGVGFLRLTYTGYDWSGTPVTASANGTVVEFSGMVGYKILLGGGFTLDPAAGFSVATLSVAGYSASTSVGGYRIGVGYSF